MLLVDFNLAEHLEPETSVKEEQIYRMGTPMFIARAVDQTGPVPPVVAFIPGIPNTPDLYATAHPDRVKRFPGSEEGFIINPEKLVCDNESRHGWRHELEHDAESVFWLLLYWAMVVQPEKCPKEKIDAKYWNPLNGNHLSRQWLIRGLSEIMSPNLTHSFYKLLQPLIKDLATILVIDSHWLPASDPRKDPFYITEAFQRLILKFIIDNRGKEFMDHPVEKTFRKVQGAGDAGF
ncbi:hypothetical protein BJV74DRAFT_200503 [Russula compacta]|nr:hypothetical protein BJV74DRAFT_200503 [Russula compacta]